STRAICAHAAKWLCVQSVLLKRFRSCGPGLARNFADVSVEHAFERSFGSCVIEAFSFLRRQQGMDVREKSAMIKFLEHAFFRLPTWDRFLLGVLDKHVDRALRVEV